MFQEFQTIRSSSHIHRLIKATRHTHSMLVAPGLSHANARRSPAILIYARHAAAASSIHANTVAIALTVHSSLRLVSGHLGHPRAVTPYSQDLDDFSGILMC